MGRSKAGSSSGLSGFPQQSKDQAGVGWLHSAHLPQASKAAAGPFARMGSHRKRLYLLAPPPDGWFAGSASQEML